MKKVNFDEEVNKLREENKLFDRLMKDLGSFDKLAKHLQADAIKRMGIKQVTYWVKE